MTALNLRTLKLRSGEQVVSEREIQLEPLELAGQRYLPVPETVQAELSITRASTGTVFELRFDNRLHGPCFRCLADAVLGAALVAARLRRFSLRDCHQRPRSIAIGRESPYAPAGNSEPRERLVDAL